jgi:hypothetical protein
MKLNSDRLALEQTARAVQAASEELDILGQEVIEHSRCHFFGMN